MFRIRFFFDAGSGICFWAGNDVTRKKYGYPIKANQLPLTEILCLNAETLTSLYDKSIDWNNPTSKSCWSLEERIVFKQKVESFFIQVQSELGSDFEVVDEARLSVAI